MSLTMQQLLADAKSLTSRLSDDDSKLNGLVSDAQTVFSTIESMREYHEDMEELNEEAHQRPRTQLVAGIQQENRHIRELQHENRELKAALEEHQNALDLIMSKYRQQVLKLIHVNKSAKPSQLRPNDYLTVAEKCQEKMQEMVTVMKKAVSVDDQVYPKQQELISRLMTENKTLRELLQISEKHGTLPPGSKKKLLWKEKQTQTDSLEENAEEEPHAPEACPACGQGLPEPDGDGGASPSESPHPGLDISVASSDTGSVDSVMMSPTRAAATKVDVSTGSNAPCSTVSTPEEAPSSIPADILT